MTIRAAKKYNRPGSPREVLPAFAKLGVSCFGGPIAHIGYFREEFVVRRRWIDESAFADLVALCQFLPGPASSQVGFSIGLMRGGYLGGLAAWTAFTLPSAVLLVLFAYGADALQGSIGAGLLHGLKLVAVAIVAQAVWGMARTLCPDRERASIAVIATMIILLSSSSVAQIGAIALGGIAGLWLCRAAPLDKFGEDPRRLRAGAGRVRPSHSLARTAACGCCARGAWRDWPWLGGAMTIRRCATVGGAQFGKPKCETPEPRRLTICNQRGETFVHVVLVMTVEERRAGIIGHEIDLCRRVTRHADGILHHSGREFVSDLRDLEGVTMRMYRMFVAAMVVHHQPVALALLDGEEGIGIGP